MVRPSFMSMFPGSLGVSGMAGGKRRKHKRRSMRGGTQLSVASFENPVGDMLSAPAQVPVKNHYHHSDMNRPCGTTRNR